MENKKNITNTIRELRIKLGYSQEYMATQLGVSQQSYSANEADFEKVSLKRIRQIADILQVELVNLLNETDTDVYKTHFHPLPSSLQQIPIFINDRKKLEKYITDLRQYVDFLESLLK